MGRFIKICYGRKIKDNRELYRERCPETTKDYKRMEDNGSVYVISKKNLFIAYPVILLVFVL